MVITLDLFEGYSPLELCVRCGMQRAGDLPCPKDNDLLRYVAGDDGSPLRVALKEFGVVHDGHVVLLLSLSRSDRHSILRKLDGLSPIWFATMAGELDNLATEVTNACQVTYSDRECVGSLFFCRAHIPTVAATSARLLKRLNGRKLGILVELAVALGVTDDYMFGLQKKFTASQLDNALEFSQLQLTPL
ncbi:hypothetical protein MPER_15116, partial [Moniliophthora perniciosa FA553]